MEMAMMFRKVEFWQLQAYNNVLHVQFFFINLCTN